MPPLILASQSPRRRKLLAGMGLQFAVVPSTFEEHLDNARTPEAVAVELALGKANDVAAAHPDSIVIGSDTIVTINGKQLEKPRDAAEAMQTLKLLAGTYNDVSTSLAVVCRARNIALHNVATSRVYFKPYDEQAVAAYVATGDPLDKAGSYGIQSGAAALIDHIEGHYDTIIGLPTHMLADMLTSIGIAAHPVTLECPVPQKL